MNEPTDTPTPERYHCFKPEHGFAIYLPDSGGIEFTQVFAEATEATKGDWSDVLGMELVHFQFVPATIYVEKLQRENQQLQRERDEANHLAQQAKEHYEFYRQKVSDYIGAEQEWIKSRNHFKQLAEEWKKLAEGYSQYTHHHAACDGLHFSNHPCDCGLEAHESRFQTLTTQQPKKDEPCSTEEKLNS